MRQMEKTEYKFHMRIESQNDPVIERTFYIRSVSRNRAFSRAKKYMNEIIDFLKLDIKSTELEILTDYKI